jgi:hypothetical protein
MTSKNAKPIFTLVTAYCGPFRWLKRDAMNAVLMEWNDCWFVGVRKGVEKWLTSYGIAPTAIPRVPSDNILVFLPPCHGKYREYLEGNIRRSHYTYTTSIVQQNPSAMFLTTWINVLVALHPASQHIDD